MQRTRSLAHRRIRLRRRRDASPISDTGSRQANPGLKRGVLASPVPGLIQIQLERGLNPRTHRPRRDELTVPRSPKVGEPAKAPTCATHVPRRLAHLRLPSRAPPPTTSLEI